MLKKSCIFVLVIFICLSFTGCSCGKSNEEQENLVQTIDIDMSEFNKQMTYAEVLAIHMSPEDYLGKTIKLRGTFDFYYELDKNSNPIPDKLHLGIIVTDAMECCSLPIDFILKKQDNIEDLPEQGTEITVTGILEQYKEPWGAFLYLSNAVVE